MSSQSHKPGHSEQPITSPCAFIIRLWQSLRGERLIPERREIDPAALAPYLANTGIFEIRSPDLTVCRLAGTAWRRSLGFELTGKNVVQLYSTDLHRIAGWRLMTAATFPCGAIMQIGLRFSTGGEAPHELVLLPLRPEQTDGNPLLLVGFAPMHEIEGQNMALTPHGKASPSFRFFNIGAGVPQSSFPPE